MYSIGYDIGSSSIKASLVEYDSGKVVAGVKYPDDEMKINSEKKRMGRTRPKSLVGLCVSSHKRNH